MQNGFKHPYITFITLIFLINVFCSFALKRDFKKEGSNTSIPFWKQAYVPDYAAESFRNSKI
jgi:hypothetical protein